MSKVDSNPKVLKKQITCVNNNYQNESITEKNTNNDGIGFNRANSLSSENTNSILHKNASESSKLASFDGGHLHRSHELENLNLTEKQLQDLVEQEDCLMMKNPKVHTHLQRTTELENLNEIETDD